MPKKGTEMTRDEQKALPLGRQEDTSKLVCLILRGVKIRWRDETGNRRIGELDINGAAPERADGIPAPIAAAERQIENGQIHIFQTL